MWPSPSIHGACKLSISVRVFLCWGFAFQCFHSSCICLASEPKLSPYSSTYIYARNNCAWAISVKNREGLGSSIPWGETWPHTSPSMCLQIHSGSSLVGRQGSVSSNREAASIWPVPWMCCRFRAYSNCVGAQYSLHSVYPHVMLGPRLSPFFAGYSTYIV